MAKRIAWLLLCLHFMGTTLKAQEAQQLIELYISQLKLAPSEFQVHIRSSYFDPLLQLDHYYIQLSYQGMPVYPNQISLHVDQNKKLVWHTGSLVLSEGYQHLTQAPIGNVREDFLIRKYVQRHQCNDVFLSLNLRSSTQDEWNYYKVQSGPDDSLRVQRCFFVDHGILFPAVRIYWQRNSQNEWWNAFLDIRSGEVFTESNEVLSCRFEEAYGNLHEPKQHDHHSIEESCVVSACQNCYQVFACPVESPGAGSRTTVYSPWLKAPNASPLGWHNDGFGNFQSTNGNNVDAYEDTDNTDKPSWGDGSRAFGGSALNFEFAIQQDQHPIVNKDAAITNLFYWTNIMHDVWYQYGFNEPAGNFQYSNFKKGGLDWDNIQAEGMDFVNAARNNASFGTPVDGSAPRMQMYVWQKPLSDTLWLEAPGKPLRKITFVPAAISPRILAPLQTELVLPEDGTANPRFACSNYINASSVAGKIVIVDMGNCSIASKISKAQYANAAGVILVQNNNNAPFAAGGLMTGVNIPVVMVSKSDGELMKSYLASSAKLTLWPPSDWKLSVNGKNYLFSKAQFGAAVPIQLTGQGRWITDNLSDFNDACQTITNGTQMANGIALIHDGICEPSYKALQAQMNGAKAALICMEGNGLPYSFYAGNYGSQVTIPVLGLSKSDCIEIKNLSNPTVQLNNTMPALIDGSFDAGIICHEYAHGISNRLTGGPMNVSCLANAEQAGEGWSDYFALAMTAQAGDHPFKRRGLGTWPSGQSTSSEGVRPTPYSADLAVCPAHYGMLKDLENISQPHGIGYVWCAMIWDLHWALVSQYGFEPDIYNSNSAKGNIKSHNLILNGLKLQACSPGFVDARNAILKADTLLYGALHASIIWNIFARRGLGFGASQGSSTKRDDGVAAYNLPPGVTYMSASQLFGQVPLSVESLTLRLTQELTFVTLDWSILGGEDLRSVHLMRRIGDGEWQEIFNKDYESAGQTYLDSAEMQGLVYYQLWVKEQSGHVLKSNIVSARLVSNDRALCRIYPNPIRNGEVHIEFDKSISGRVDLQVYHDLGKSYFQKSVRLDRAQKYTLDLGEPESGYYYISVQAENFHKIFKLCIMN